MDTTASTQTSRRKWLAWLLAPLALAFAGCEVKVTNLTPSSMKANPSQTYTVAAQVAVKNSAIIENSVKPEIVIDGKAFPMSLAPDSDSLWEYDYKMPTGRDSATYYLLVRYIRKTSNGETTKEIFTELDTFSIENRYSVELEVNRAPVGAKIAILGRGFTLDDKVLVGGTPAASRFESSTSLAFYVPLVPEGRNYDVKVLGLNGEISAGSLRVDASQIHVTPNTLNISQGQKRPLAFSIPESAPPGGLRISVTTDIPSSVIMPEVVIPAGQRSTSVTVEGGAPGNGDLYVEVSGYTEVVIPITVN